MEMQRTLLEDMEISKKGTLQEVRDQAEMQRTQL
jgi:hypothetical protein